MNKAEEFLVNMPIKEKIKLKVSSKNRDVGILTHISSLPTNQLIGDLGSSAFDFIDFLHSLGFNLWQFLPIGPTSMDFCPYQNLSAFAGNPFFISLEELSKKNFLHIDINEEIHKNNTTINVDDIRNFKLPLLWEAFQNFNKKQEFEKNKKLHKFSKVNSYWIEDYSLFMSIREKMKQISWTDWPEELKIRDETSLKKWKRDQTELINYYTFEQFIFFEQFRNVHDYAKKMKVKLIGDIPIFVSFDSADVWAHPELFCLSREFQPTFVAGVPPDYFSETGQLWGNPLYNWDKMKKEKYKWWIKRILHLHSYMDIIRIDHFRGFESYWQIPSHSTTAIHGKWVKGPKKDLFKHLPRKIKKEHFIAEDLGIITEEVEKMIEDLGYPRMKVLQFAFDDNDKNPHLPQNYEENCVAYTGTHDNETTLGWYRNLADLSKKMVHKFISLKEEPEKELEEKDVTLALIKKLWHSKAKKVIIPLQDLLFLDNDSRMNTPGTIESNWIWQAKPEQLLGVNKALWKKLNKNAKRGQNN